MNRSIDGRRSALVLVDYQERLLPAIHGGREAVELGVRLAAVAQVLGIPVLGTEQSPDGLGPNAPAVRAACGRTLAKVHFDACQDGLLEAIRQSREPAPSEVVVAGCEAHVCLLQTALGLLRAGHTVWVVADACGSRLAANHALAMQRLRDAGAGLVSFEMVAFEWLRSSEHPQFRRVLQIVKGG